MAESLPRTAHLNGGPMSGKFIQVEGHEVRVARPARLSLVEVQPDDRVLHDEGRYLMRVVLGQPVAHDLSSVEFDWQGWA